MKYLATVIGVTLLCQTANAQSFNIDINIRFGGYEAGAGAPSATFGGAANSPGFWNAISAGGGPFVHSLNGLNGERVDATLQYNQSGALAGSGWNGNDGDHRLLMNDGTVVTIPQTFNFAGLQPGRYEIFTYLADRSGRDVPGDVTILGADVETKVSGVGGMPGNEFIEGRTHAAHDVTLTTSSLAIQVRTNPPGPPSSTLAGFQIVRMPVPEPSGALLLASALTVLLVFSRRKP
ncbi:MAG TPA: PEP-CTERM sorting domain-containing protein [Fimbriimonadaceae bacterium]|nr:PEP-CTERM sorting domain-containing protein [Fimbriimonadaceae bacterium]